MKENWRASFLETLKHEGGFSNHPSDPGGATNLGIILKTFRRYKPGASVDDLKKLKASDPIVESIYVSGYWDACRCSELPSGVDYSVYDFAVNSGPSRAVKTLQAVLNVPQDGLVGPVTLNAVWRLSGAEVVSKHCAARLAFLRRLKTWPTFGKGWSRRVEAVEKFAGKLTVEAPTIPTVPPSQLPYVSRTPWEWIVAVIAAIGAILARLVL